MENVERPHFFPGQWIDYRDFNALSDLPEDTFSLFSRKLVEGGGLAVTAQHEFSVVPREGLLVQVRPGVALLPNGHFVALEQDVLLNLEPFRGRTVIAQISLERTGTQPYVDPEDSSVRGFTRQRTQAQISLGETLTGGLELFRIRIGNHARKVRLAESHEQWAPSPDLESLDPSEAVLDLRHRRVFLPLTHGQLPPLELIQARTALYEISRDLKALHRSTWVETPDRVLASLANLHAELLSMPIQIHRVGFWVSEVAEELADWIEKVVRKTQRTEWLALLTELAPLRRHEIHPRIQVLQYLAHLSQRLRDITQLTERHYSVTSVISDALAETQSRYLEFKEKITLGGHVLSRADWVTISDRHRIATSHPAVERLVRSKFASGERLALPGLLVREGTFQTELRVPHVTSPGILLLRWHARRPREEVSVELNGRLLGRLSKRLDSAEDLWMNSGFIVPEADLVAGDNQVRLTVHRADLEWGLFELAYYQIDGRHDGGSV